MNKLDGLWFLAIVVSLAATQPRVTFAEDDEKGFEEIFDGKTLKGWDGREGFWRVEDGAITGQTTEEKPTKGNTFLIWRAGKVSDFELRLKYRIVGGNSGIQYRSEEVDKWVMKGYQADFDAANVWAGILYEEKGSRQIMAKRGTKVHVTADGKKEVVGKTTAEEKIVAGIKKEDWNEYVIIAKGNHLIHKINGNVTIDVIDDDKKNRRMSGLLALQLHAGPPMKVQFKDIRIKHFKKAETSSSGRKKVVFVAGRRSHGTAHTNTTRDVCCSLGIFRTIWTAMKRSFTKNGWPKEGMAAFEGADCVVVYCDGGGGHVLNPHVDEFDKLMDKGVGLVCIHYAVETPKGKTGDAFLNWMGGYFEAHWSVNPHWDADFKSLPSHEITRGVKPFKINDEWYFHMRFRDDMKGVTPILSAHPPESTMSRPDGAHSGNPHVRAAVKRGDIQHVAWASQRENGGRGFGFTGGHFHWNWGDDNFRKVVLNAIIWASHGTVPENGVGGDTPSREELEANQDFPKPQPKQSARARTRRGRPNFATKVVDTNTPGHMLDVRADIKGAKKLFLVVDDGGNGFSCDWADWIEPKLIGPAGEKKLTDLKWKSAVAEWGSVYVDKNCGGGAMRVDGKPVSGIGTHANSVIEFDLPDGYSEFIAQAGLDNGGTDQNGGSQTSVRFLVFTSKPPRRFTRSVGVTRGVNQNADRTPDTAVANLDVHPNLTATLFAAEPMLLSPANIDIDAKGRVWVCEIVNYRRHNGKRPEGDRILILEDTDGDGVADSKKTYYQGRDIDSPHGVCVLGNRVLVSVGENVFVFTDEDGDDKPDDKQILFTGISGTQHDHGIHQFMFGPDGKLYFNFGNEGKQLKRADGKLVVDEAGREVREHRQPYQQGMVFRCDLDGSNLETLGWNFRNNWMVTVDSFGTIWQSDNDDDGNEGVRINYVMEYGDFGYRDSKTGAGWKSVRTGMHTQRAMRHWHQNDPGVVPNLLNTGAGSPTGIIVYEGDLLPRDFSWPAYPLRCWSQRCSQLHHSGKRRRLSGQDRQYSERCPRSLVPTIGCESCARWVADRCGLV